MATDTSRSRRFVSVYRNEYNRVIIPVVDGGKTVLKDKCKDSGKASTDDQVDSIDSGVDLSYSAVDADEPIYSSSGCDTDCDVDSSTVPSPTANNVVHILCRYDSPEVGADSSVSTLRDSTTAVTSTSETTVPGPVPGPDSGADESGAEFSSVVEIDGDCVIIHSRQEVPAPPGGDVDDGSRSPESIAELCRNFLRSRSRIASASAMSSLPSSSLPSSEENCRRRHATADSIDSQRSSSAYDTLSTKMVRLRQEMSSLASQDDELFRQLLQLHSSIQTLRNSSCMTSADDVTPSSSVCSLPEAIDSCSPVSTLSSTGSRHSQLSSDSTGHYEVINPLFSSTPVLKPPRSVSAKFQPFATLSSGTRFGQSKAGTPSGTSSRRHDVIPHPPFESFSQTARRQRDCSTFSEQDRYSRTLPKHSKSREIPLPFPKPNQQPKQDRFSRTLPKHPASRDLPLPPQKPTQHQQPALTKNKIAPTKQSELKAASSGAREAPTKINNKHDDIEGASQHFFKRTGRAIAMRAQSSTTLPGRRARSVSSGQKSWRFQP